MSFLIQQYMMGNDWPSGEPEKRPNFFSRRKKGDSLSLAQEEMISRQVNSQQVQTYPVRTGSCSA